MKLSTTIEKSYPVRWLEKRLLNWIDINRPLPIQIDVINSCNLSCSHCYHDHHKNSGAINYDAWTKLLIEYFELTKYLGFKPAVIICGGEPFLYPDLFKLLAFIRAMEPEAPVSILSNGTLVNSILAKRLAEFQNITIQVSIDGATSATHDKARGVNAFSKTQKGVSELLKAGVKVSLLCVLSKRTSAEIDCLFQLAKNWGVSAINFTRLIPNGQAQDLVASGEDQPLFREFLRDAFKAILKASAATKVRTSTTQPLMHLLHPSLGSSGRYWEGIVIDFKGRMLASSRSRIVIGNAVEEGIKKIFLHHPILTAVRLGKVEGCGACEHYRRCGGDRNSAFGASGNYLGKDPGCWKVEK